WHTIFSMQPLSDTGSRLLKMVREPIADWERSRGVKLKTRSNGMSTQNVTMKHENRRGWFVAVLLVSVVLVASVAWYLLNGMPGTTANEVSADTPAALWEAQGIDDYQYTVQVG